MDVLKFICLVSFCFAASAESQPKSYRDPAQVRIFKKLNPCPATGKVQHICKGYVVDHIVPLACGGADNPFNMQWQTIADGKAKDKTERKNCKKGKL